jgi:two-component system NtrC family sensor kinase
MRDDEPDLPAVRADRDQLRQVLLNILSNAYEAVQAAAQAGMGPNGGSVTVRTASSDGKVSIAVVDTGIGMDEETRAQMFEPFFTRKTRGTGLGLAVTRRIVDSHGGVIHIDSAEGRGTTFTVEFPIADERGVLE